MKAKLSSLLCEIFIFVIVLSAVAVYGIMVHP